MQRLGDIVSDDLNKIFTFYRDVTKEMVIQCGTVKKTVYASFQIADTVFNAESKPLNAFSATLYIIDPNDSDFEKSLVTDAIIYVDSKPYRIIDKATVRGLWILSLESKKGR